MTTITHKGQEYDFPQEAVELAKLFHDTYEQFAPVYGYKTRKDTKKFNQKSPNGKLMMAVSCKILETFHFHDSAVLRNEVKAQGLADFAVFARITAESSKKIQYRAGWLDAAKMASDMAAALREKPE